MSERSAFVMAVAPMFLQGSYRKVGRRRNSAIGTKISENERGRAFQSVRRGIRIARKAKARQDYAGADGHEKSPILGHKERDGTKISGAVPHLRPLIEAVGQYPRKANSREESY